MLEHRALLDVELEITPDSFRIEMRRLAAHVICIEPALFHVLRKRTAAVHANRGVELFGTDETERHAAAEMSAVRPRKPAPRFFRAHTHYHDVARRRDARLLERAKRRESGDHTRGAIVVAAFGNRIEMRSDHPRRSVAIAAVQRH